MATLIMVTNKSWYNTMKKQRPDSTDTMCCMTVGDLDKHEMPTVPKFTSKTRNRESQQNRATENHNRTVALEWSVINKEGWGLQHILWAQNHHQFLLQWFKPLSELHGSYDVVFYAPNFEKVGSILLLACLFVRPFKKILKLGF